MTSLKVFNGLTAATPAGWQLLHQNEMRLTSQLTWVTSKEDLDMLLNPTLLEGLTGTSQRGS